MPPTMHSLENKKRKSVCESRSVRAPAYAPVSVSSREKIGVEQGQAWQRSAHEKKNVCPQKKLRGDGGGGGDTFWVTRREKRSTWPMRRKEGDTRVVMAHFSSIIMSGSLFCPIAFSCSTSMRLQIFSRVSPLVFLHTSTAVAHHCGGTPKDCWDFFCSALLLPYCNKDCWKFLCAAVL